MLVRNRGPKLVRADSKRLEECKLNFRKALELACDS